MPFHTLHLGLRLVLHVQGPIRFGLHVVLFTLGFALFVLDLDANEFPIVPIPGRLVEVGFEAFHFFEGLLAAFGLDDHAAVCPEFEPLHEVVLGGRLLLDGLFVLLVEFLQGDHFEFFELPIFFHLTTMAPIPLLPFRAEVLEYIVPEFGFLEPILYGLSNFEFLFGEGGLRDDFLFDAGAVPAVVIFGRNRP